MCWALSWAKCFQTLYAGDLRWALPVFVFMIMAYFQGHKRVWMELFWEMPVAVCLGQFELVGQIVRWISRQVVLVTTKNVLSPKHILFILIYIYIYAPSYQIYSFPSCKNTLGGNVDLWLAGVSRPHSLLPFPVPFSWVAVMVLDLKWRHTGLGLRQSMLAKLSLAMPVVTVCKGNSSCKGCASIDLSMHETLSDRGSAG